MQGWLHVSAQPLSQRLKVLSFAFPNSNYTPAQFVQFAVLPSVSADVLLKFRFPEAEVAFGRVGEPASGMTMPIATMNQDNRASARQNNVGPPRQVFPVQAESVSHPVE